MTCTDVVAQIGEQQLGLVSIAAARAAGVSRAALRRGVAAGRYEPVSPGVLRVRGTPPSDRHPVLAAVLEAGPGAAACGPTAAALWGVRGYRLQPVHIAIVGEEPPAAGGSGPVTSAGAGRVGAGARAGAGPAARGLAGLAVPLPSRPPPVRHRIPGLAARYVTVLDGVPVVRPEVVVFQVCGREHRERAGRVLDDLWRRRLLSGASVRHTLDDLAVAGGTSPGPGRLRRLLHERGGDYVPPASGLERRFAQILARNHLPAMRRQVDVGADGWVGRVDFRDRSLPLVVEVQSETYHSALSDRRRDAARSEALRAAGFEVVEVTGEQIWHRPDEVVAAVRNARWRLHVTLAPRVAPSVNQRGRT
jgi:very-short-patch-repair endonuclease